MSCYLIAFTATCCVIRHTSHLGAMCALKGTQSLRWCELEGVQSRDCVSLEGIQSRDCVRLEGTQSVRLRACSIHKLGSALTSQAYQTAAADEKLTSLQLLCRWAGNLGGSCHCCPSLIQTPASFGSDSACCALQELLQHLLLIHLLLLFLQVSSNFECDVMTSKT